MASNNNENVPKAGDGDNIGDKISNVDKIIAKIRDYYILSRVQEEDREWWSINLGLDEFKEFKAFEARFGAEEDERWPRYDYFSGSIAKFVLRMRPSAVHEGVIGRFSRLIFEQLYDIRRSNHQVAANFARSIRSTGSVETKTENDDIHSPDGSFAHKDAIAHGVVLEVSYSQCRKFLPLLAQQYILGSKGLTQLVIGIDIEYQQKKGKEARVILWRPKITKEDGQFILTTEKTLEGIFRDADGNLVNGGQNLQIWLKDFGNKLNFPEIQEAQEVINVSFAQLYEIVQETEDIQQTRKRMEGFDEISQGIITREIYPRATVSGRLRESNEQKFKEAEEKVKKKLNDQDEDYIPSN